MTATNVALAAFLSGVGMLSIALSYATYRLLLRATIMDVPNERSSHSRPVPRGVGIGFAAAWMVGASVAVFATATHPTAAITVMVLAAALALLGFMDDLKGIDPLVRFGAQMLIALMAVSTGLKIEALAVPGIGYVPLGLFAIPVCAIGLVALVNFFNFMDGIDGLAAGHTLVAASVLAAAAFLFHVTTVGVLSASLAAAAAGFLPLNWHPARCFMGDAGSYFLGGCLGGLLLLGEGSGVPLLVAGLASLPFLLDPMVTLTRRIISKQRIWKPHRSHFYQRLVASGWSHERVALSYMVSASVIGVLSIGILLRMYHGSDISMLRSHTGASGPLRNGTALWRLM